MKSSKLVFLLGVALIALVFTSSYAHAEAKSLPAAQHSLASVLNPDGTLNLAVAEHQSLNARGYRMTMDANGAPHFTPNGTNPNSPGDENWQAGFRPQGVSSCVPVGSIGCYTIVYAVAASGNDMYVGGNFLQAGDVAAKLIARYNTTTRQWYPLGDGLDPCYSGGCDYNAHVGAIAIDSDGNVIAGGKFYSSGETQFCGSVAKFDGTSWSQVGSCAPGEVNTLVADGGNIYAGGSGSGSSAYVDQFNGTDWTSLGSGFGNIDVLSVKGGYLYAGGEFSSISVPENGAPAVSTSGIARWNLANDPTSYSSVWEKLGEGVGGFVWAIAWQGSDLYVGGKFEQALNSDGNGGNIPVTVNHIAKFSGGAWSALGQGVVDPGSCYPCVTSLAFVGSNLYVGGIFNQVDGDSGPAAHRLAVWDGSSWSAIGEGVGNDVQGGYVRALATDGSNLYLGGYFYSAGDKYVSDIAGLNGTNWSILGGDGVQGSVKAVVVSGSKVYVGGSFVQAGNVHANGLALWDGTNWSELGDGVMNGTRAGSVYAIAIKGSNVYVGGNFDTAGGVSANGIAMWDGSQWQALGSGVAYSGDTAYVEALAVSGTDLYVGGYFQEAGGSPASAIAKWDTLTNSWSALGAGVDDGYRYGEVYTIVPHNSDIYVGGYFVLAGSSPANYIARWDGSAWHPLGSDSKNGVDSTVDAIAFDGETAYVGGSFRSMNYDATNYTGDDAHHIALFNGCWGTLTTNAGEGANGEVRSLLVSNHNVYAAGDFTTAGGAAAQHIASWDGTNWNPLGSGVTGVVYTIGGTGSNLYVGGGFSTAGDKSSIDFGHWTGSEGTGQSPASTGSCNPATLVVNTTSDDADTNAGDGVCLTSQGECSLRAAIEESNAHSGADTITFSISGSGIPHIQPSSLLPTITDPVTIDATTQPTTARIELDAQDIIGCGLDGCDTLVITAGSSTVRGLIVNNSGGKALVLRTKGGNTIAGNWLGLGTDGVTEVTNNSNLLIDDSPDNVIGGTTAADRNVIAGSVNGDITIKNSSATGNLVEGNYIGTNTAGDTQVSIHHSGGISILSAPNNTIGGTNAGARNVIANGIFISTDNTIVQGNYLGTDAAGLDAIGDAIGVDIAGSNNTIGGSDPGARNLISGNGGAGVEIAFNSSATYSGNKIQNNYIGVDVTGGVALPNANGGVIIKNLGYPTGSATGNLVSGNVIAGNNKDGIQFTGPNVTQNTIQGNLIGVAANGTTALGNDEEGIRLFQATNNTIGGTNSGEGNVIAANGAHGISLDDESDQNIIQGNHIGTDATDTAALGNQAHGISIGNSNGNTIAANTIVKNQLDGISLYGMPADNNIIHTNYIGTNASGSNLGNVGNGISLLESFFDPGPTNNELGGPGSGEGNTIAFNGANGIDMVNFPNPIRGNTIVSNTLLGIDVGDDGLSTSGLPLITGASRDNGNITITGTYSGTANATYKLDFFDNSACDSSGFGEGGVFLGKTSAQANNKGKVSFNVTLSDSAQDGFPTATVTDTDGNTSEFSKCFGQGGLVVNSTNDDADTNPGDGVCLTSKGECTLRAAVQEANATTGSDTITFNISGSGIPTIKPGSPLPSITDPVTIDGASEPNSSKVELDGENVPPGTNSIGLNITAGSSTVQGMVINRFGFAGIVLDTKGGNTILGDWIGPNSDGTTNTYRQNIGIRILNSPGNTIGGSTANARNVISGQIGDGIDISGNTSKDNLILGNYIGTNLSGTQVLGNHGYGIGVGSTAHNMIGGTNAGEGNLISGNGDGIDAACLCNSSQLVIQGNYIGTDASGQNAVPNGKGIILFMYGVQLGGATAGSGNVISGNTGDGIEINNQGSGSTIQGNWIGTQADHSGSLPNGGDGIHFLETPFDQMTIGGINPGEGNVIAFNKGDGIYAYADMTRAIRGNSIYSNDGLGIHDDDGAVRPSAQCDNQPYFNPNYPLLLGVEMSGGNTTIRGAINCNPFDTYTLDFFSSPACDPSGFGEGKKYLGSKDVTADKDGNANFSFTSSAVSNGEFVTATMLSPDESGTSPFSNCLAAPTPFTTNNDLYITQDAPTTIATNGDLIYDVEVGNHGPIEPIDAVITYTLPSGVSLVSEFPTRPLGQDLCDDSSDGTAIICHLGQVPVTDAANDNTAGVSLEFTVTAPEGSVITSTVSVATAFNDTNLSNNTNIVTTTVGGAAQTYAASSGNCSGSKPCYNNINTAINNTAPNGTVTVSAGSYTQDVNLNANVTVNLNGDVTLNAGTAGAPPQNPKRQGKKSKKDNALSVLTNATGSLTISKGTFNSTAGNLKIAGNFGLTGGAFNARGGTVTFDGTSKQTVTGNATFHNVTISAGSTVDTGSSTLHLDGTLNAIGTLSHEAAPQTVTASNGTVSFTDALGKPAVKLTSTGTTDLGSTGVNVNTHVAPPACGTNTYRGTLVLRYVDITPTNQTNVAATVRLYYDPGTEANGTTLGNLLLLHCDGTTWSELSGTYTTGTEGGLNYIELPNVTSFSPFALGAPTSPTTVTLSSFLAKFNKKKNWAQVLWQTGVEVNLKGFNVYRSTKPKGKYQKLTKKLIAAKAQGQANGSAYAFKDKTTQPHTVYYYKLQMVLTDGTIVWSDVIKLKVP